MSEPFDSITYIKETIAALSEPFPSEAIKQREGGRGKMLSYVETETVIRRLNRVVGSWDFRITDKVWREFDYTDRNNQERHNIVLTVFGEMTIPGLGTRSGTGVQIIEDGRGGEDMVKGAASDCLKKCATLFGVGIELYGPDIESSDAVAAYYNKLNQDTPYGIPEKWGPGTGGGPAITPPEQRQPPTPRNSARNNNDAPLTGIYEPVATTSPDAISMPQLKFLRDLFTRHEVPDDQVLTWIENKNKVPGPAYLNKAGAKEWIDFLKNTPVGTLGH